MVAGILSHTPAWVWLLFVVLIAWGLRQTRAHQASLQRVTLLPLAMAVWSLYGASHFFDAQPWSLLAWLGAVSLALWNVARRPVERGTQFRLHDGLLTLPGSWTPMLVLLGMFCTKYAVGVTNAIAPELLQTGQVALLLNTAYGCLSGILLGRALRLWRLARDTEAQWHGQATQTQHT